MIPTAWTAHQATTVRARATLARAGCVMKVSGVRVKLPVPNLTTLALWSPVEEMQRKYSRLSLSRSQRDPLKHFEISVLRHIRCAELRKIPNEQPNFTNEHVI